MNCDRLKTIDTGMLDVLPEGIFCGCADLTTLTLDCSMIGDRAFYLCTGLVKAELPENVSLGRDAFGLCPGLSN